MWARSTPFPAPCPSIFGPSGLSFAQQIDELVDIAIRAQKDKNENSFAYDTNLLRKFKGGGKLVK